MRKLYLLFVILLSSPTVAVTPALMIDLTLNPKLFSLFDGEILSYSQLQAHIVSEGYVLKRISTGEALKNKECVLLDPQTEGSLDIDTDGNQVPDINNYSTKSDIVLVTCNDNGSATVLTALTVNQAFDLNTYEFDVELGLVRGELLIEDGVGGYHTFTVDGPSVSVCVDVTEDFCIGGDANTVSISWEIVGEQGNGVEFGLGGKGVFKITHENTCIGFFFFVCVHY